MWWQWTVTIEWQSLSTMWSPVLPSLCTRIRKWLSMFIICCWVTRWPSIGMVCIWREPHGWMVLDGCHSVRSGPGRNSLMSSRYVLYWSRILNCFRFCGLTYIFVERLFLFFYSSLISIQMTSLKEEMEEMHFLNRKFNEPIVCSFKRWQYQFL